MFEIPTQCVHVYSHRCLQIACIHALIYVCVHVYLHIYTGVCARLDIFENPNTDKYVCVYDFLVYVCMYTLLVYVYIYIHIYMHTCIYA